MAMGVKVQLKTKYIHVCLIEYFPSFLSVDFKKDADISKKHKR